MSKVWWPDLKRIAWLMLVDVVADAGKLRDRLAGLVFSLSLLGEGWGEGAKLSVIVFLD